MVGGSEGRVGGREGPRWERKYTLFKGSLRLTDQSEISGSRTVRRVVKLFSKTDSSL